MRQTFASPRSGRNLHRVQRMVEPMVMTILRNPNTLWHMTALTAHDYETYAHSVNVAMFLIGAAHEVLGIQSRKQLHKVAYGAVLHDIGKTELPPYLLHKPGQLTDEEFGLIRSHPLLGLEIVGRYGKVPTPASFIIRSHHENVAGHGYPDGLAGNAIPTVARLARIVDAFDAMTTHRPYARASTAFDALNTMAKMDGHFDVPMLRCFVQFLGPHRPSSEFVAGSTSPRDLRPQ